MFSTALQKGMVFVSVHLILADTMMGGAVASALVACAAPKSCCMAVVPRGPGPHDFAIYLNLPLNAIDALEIAANGDSTPIDVGLLNKEQVNHFISCCLATGQTTEEFLM